MACRPDRTLRRAASGSGSVAIIQADTGTNSRAIAGASAAAIFTRPGVCTGWIQPVCSASAAIACSRTVSNSSAALSRISPAKRSPAAP